MKTTKPHAWVRLGFVTVLLSAALASACEGPAYSSCLAIAHCVATCDDEPEEYVCMCPEGTMRASRCDNLEGPLESVVDAGVGDAGR